MTGSVVDMAPFWREVAAPAATAIILAAAYVCAAWKWPAFRTPIASLRMWRLNAPCWICDIPARAESGPAYWFVRWHLHRMASK